MQKSGGISRYICALARELALSGEISARVFGGISSNLHLRQLKPAAGLTVQSLRRRDHLRINTLVGHASRQWRRIAFSLFRKQYDRVLYHASYYDVDPKISALADATVVTFYDMIPEWQAKNNPSPKSALAPAQKRAAASRADLILAISESTRRDVLQTYPDLKLNPVVTYLAADLPVADNTPLPHGLAPREYFLMVGNRAAYKNGMLGFKAFAQIAKSHPEIRLVCFGGENLLPEESALLQQHALGSRVIQLRGGDELLTACYREAVALIYPSRFEGFGLPVLEAMQSSCPVVTTKCSSLPEVGGDAALYVEPDDETGLAQTMRTLIDDRALRETIIQRGSLQVKKFSWQKTATNTLAAYRDCLKI